jgi:type III pantothenate kinase
LILAIDVGNTNTVIGLMDGEKVVQTWRLSTVSRTTDELGLLWLQLLGHYGYTAGDIHGAVCGSVVPSVVFNLEKATRRYLECDLMMVNSRSRTGMKIRTDNPKEVGADRIVNAVGAIAKWGGPVIVVDFGTATTFDCVNADNEYIGGAIAPGYRISEEALVSHTAQLPRIEVSRPASAIGKNTVHAMQAGLYFGYVGLVDALARRCREELSPTAKVVATGGLATMIADGSEVIEEVDPHLTLRGLALVHARNR